MMMWHSHIGGGIGCWAMALVVIAFWAVLITGLLALIRYTLSSSINASAVTSLVPDSAEDVLAQRYARGEIDEVEYQRRLILVRQSTSEW